MYRIASFVIIGLFVGAAACSGARSATAPDQAPAALRRAAPRVVTLRGSPAERGRIQGQLFRDEIRSGIVPYVREVVPRMVGGRERALEYAERIEPRVPEEARVEMRALAEAAGVEYEDVLLFNVLADLLAAGCSTAVVSGERAAGGVVRLGRNVDLPMPAELQPAAYVAVVDPVEGLSHAGYTLPGMIGPPSAINEAGVAYAINVTATTEPTMDCLPIAVAARAALEQSRDARGFVERLAAVRHCGGLLIAAADEHEGLALEIAPGRTAILEPDQGLVTLTNHYQTSTMLPLQLDAPEESRVRLDVLRRALDRPEGAGVGVVDLQRALMSEQVLKPYTLLSVVLEPASRTMWVWERGRNAPDFEPLDLSGLLRAP